MILLGKIKGKYLFQYKLNIDNEPMLICDYIDKKNITVYFPCLNLWKRTSISSFKKGLVFPYEHRHYTNEYNIQSDFVQVFCYDTHGKCKGSFLVDYLDFYKIKDAHWKFDKDGYPFSEKYGKLHQYLMSTPKGHEVDHINRNKKDNRRSNLNIVNRTNNNYNQNMQKNNTSGLVGVRPHKGQNSWDVELRCEGIRYRKTFPTKLEAAIYRRKLELEYSRYFLRPELEEYLLENISDENLLIELELKSK